MGLESRKNTSNKLKERRLTELVMKNSKIFTSIVPSAIKHDSEATSHNISEIDYTHFSWSSSTAASRSTQTAGESCNNSNSTLIEFSETETEKIKQYGPGFNIISVTARDQRFLEISNSGLVNFGRMKSFSW